MAVWDGLHDYSRTALYLNCYGSIGTEAHSILIGAIPFPLEPQYCAQRERCSGHPLAWVTSDAACGPMKRRRFLREASLCRGVFTVARRAGSHGDGFEVVL